jgi:23S rRNA (uracil1939-C5)-methyltransferase
VCSSDLVNPLFTELKVVDAAAKGKSVAKAPDGRVIFLSNAVPGDIVDVQTFKKRKAYYEGKAVKFHQYSPMRTEPKCEHFGVCGGCKWQHMDYVHQLTFKNKEVENNLLRQAKLEVENFEPIFGSTKQYEYRNKMEFSFSNNRWLSLEEIQSDRTVEDKNALGFHIPGMWDKILDLNNCHLQAAPSNEIRNEVKKFAQTKGFSFFDLRKQTGLLRTLMIRTTSVGELMVLIQFFENDTEKINALLNHLKEQFPSITSLLYVINNKANDTLYDLEIKCFSGRDYILEEMEGLSFKIQAKSFYQTNSDQAYELYKIAREYAQLKGDETVYDLYTGTGTIAQFVASKAKKVIGVESVEDAIIDARENAKNNGIDNVSFHVGDMKNVFTDEFLSLHGTPDVIITDPPRVGMHKDVVEQILKASPKRIVYVSCNSATQARDLDLMRSMYRIVKSRAVDMFPQIHHVENVVLLEKI